MFSTCTAVTDTVYVRRAVLHFRASLQLIRWLHYNYIRTISNSTFAGMPKLTSLFVEHREGVSTFLIDRHVHSILFSNRISNLPARAFHLLPSLTTLCVPGHMLVTKQHIIRSNRRLDSNWLTAIAESSFAGLPELTSLCVIFLITTIVFTTSNGD